MPLYGNPYLTQEEDAQANAIADDQFKKLEDEYLHNRLMDMLQNVNNTDSEILQQQHLKEISQLKQANENLRQNGAENLHALAQERIAALIKEGEFDGNRLLSIIENDPILSQVYPTDSSKLGLINQIQEAQKQEADPANAVQGKTIDTEDSGFWGTAFSSLKSGFKNTAASLWHDPQRIKTLKELNSLPADRLTQIKKKLELQEELKSKLFETSENLTSLDPAEKAKALQQYNLYKQQLDGMALNQEEQALWNNYGDRFTDLIGKKELLRAERNDFTGANVITPTQAKQAMEDYSRDRYFERYKGGASYTNLEYAKEAIRSKFTGSALGSDLGAIAASALPFMLGGIPGIIGKGASLTSDAMARFTDSLEHYFDKYGSIPTDKEIKALAGAIGSAVIDFYGSTLFVKGLSQAGVVKSIENRLKDSLYSVKALGGSLNSRSMAAAVGAQLRLRHLRPDAEDLSKSLNKAAKDVEESLKGTPLTLSEKAVKGAKTALATANEYAHNFANVGLQDIAIAGTKLAGENVGASLVDQWAKNEYSFNDIVDSAISGFVGGGMFHAGAAPAHVALHALKEKYANYRAGKFSKLDSNEEWQKSLDLINDKSNAAYKTETIEEFTKRYKGLKGDIQKELNTEINKVKKQYGDLVTQDKEGNWVINTEADTGLTSKQLKTAYKEVKSLNDLQTTVAEASKTIDLRLSTLSNMEQSAVESAMEEATKEGSTMSKEAKEKAKEEFYEKVTDVDKKKKALSKDLKVSEEQAQHILEKKSDIITEDEAGKEFKNTISEFGETNAYIYEDLFGKTKVTNALKDKDYEAFEAALEEEVKANNITKERKDKLLETFTPEVFEETSRTDNQVDELGMKENAEAGTKYVAPFSEYNKATQKDTKKALGLTDTKSDVLDSDNAITDYTAVKDFTKLGEEDPLASAIANKLLGDKDINTATVDVKNQVEAKVNASTLSDAEKTNLKKTIFKDIDAIANKTKSALQEANKVNKELSGKKLYKTKESAEKELKNYTNKHSVNSFYVKQVGDKYILADAMTEIPEEKIDELKAIVDSDTSTVADINKWFTDNKSYYDKVTYKNKPLSNFIQKEFLDKVAAVKIKDKAEQDKLKKEVYKNLLNINASITSSLDGEIKSEAEGISHAYTNAQWVKEFKERTRKAEETIKEQNKTDSKTRATRPEDIEEDVVVALSGLFDEFKFDRTTAINEKALITALSDLNKIGNGVSYGDLILLDSYRKRITAEKKYKNRENTLKYMACLTAIFDLAKKNNLVNMDDKSNHVLLPFGKKGHTWETSSERRQVINAILHFYKEGTESLNDSDAFADITIPDGVMSSSANSTMEDESFRRKINSYKAFYRRLFRSKRIKNVQGRITEILNTLNNYTEVSKGIERVTALGLIRNELGSLTTEEERILTNPNELKVSPKVFADLFIKIMQTNAFKRFFGLVPAIPNASGKLSQIKDDATSFNNVISGKSNALATFTSDTVTNTANTNSSYDNLVALDTYLGMEGMLYETFWNLYSGESDELNAIRDRYRFKFATSEQNSAFSSSHTYRHFSKVIEKIVKNLNLAKLDYNALYNNVNKAIRSGRFENILEGVTIPTKLAESNQIYADSKLKLNFFDQNAYMAALAQAIASQRMYQIADFNNEFEAYKQANQVFQLAEVLKRVNPEGYNTHEEIPINTVDGSQLNNLTSVIRNAMHEVTETTADDGTVTTSQSLSLKDLVNFNKSVADKEYHLDDADTTLSSLFTFEGDYRDIPDFENKPLSEGNDKVAKFLAAYINSNTAIKNAYKGKKSTGTKQEIRSSNTNTHIENDILTSSYAKDFYIGDVEDASPLASDNFIRDVMRLNPEYADIAGLQQFINRIKTLVKVASKFSYTSGNLADEIFFQKFGNGTGTYNREVVTTVAGTALGMLTRMATGQSQNWIDKQVANGLFSERAGRAFAASNFISKNNLGEDLGLQILRALNIKSDSPDASYNAKVKLAAALAGRALNMLADSSVGGKEGLVQVKYFDCNTGDVYTAQPTSGKFISVIEMTETGKRWADEIIQLNEARGTENGNRHLLSDLLNLNIDGRNYKQAKEREQEQQKLAKRFDEKNAKQIKPSLFEKPANGKEVDITYDEKHDIVKVVLDNDTKHTVYLNRHEIIKKDGTMLSFSRLQENAYQKDTGYIAHKDEIMNEFSYLRDSSGKWFNTLAEFEKAYASQPDLLKVYKDHLGLKQIKSNGYFSRIDANKNEVQFKQILDFCKEMSQLKADANGDVELYFPVINTINNRVYVDSLGINPRELKFLRHYFSPKVSIYDGSGNAKVAGDNTIPAGRTSEQTAILFSLVGANFGLDTDKAPMEELKNAGIAITEALANAAKDLKITVSRNTSVADCMAIIDKANEILANNKVTYATTKRKDRTQVKLEKSGEGVLAVKEILRQVYDLDADEDVSVANLMLENKAIDDFRLRLEIDGLTNGIGFHLSTSSWFGNNDAYSYALLAGVGIFPKDFNNMGIRDFVSAKMKAGALDSYEHLGVDSREAALTNFINSVVEDGRDAIRNNTGLLKILQTTYGITSSDYSEIFNQILDRDTMKYVLMPASYGAGRDALVKYVLTQISRKISERVFSMYSAENPDYVSVHHFYSQLAALNGGKLTLVDGDNNELIYTGQELSELQIKSYSVLLPINNRLNEIFSTAIAEPIVNAADNLMSAAEEHTEALTKAASAISSTFNEMLATVLTSPEWKDVDLSKLTRAQIDNITKRIQTAIHIGSDASSLNLLKEAVENSVEVLKLRIPSLLKKGKGIVLSAKNTLTRESIASALAPEVNHTKDSDAINRLQAAVRDSLGAFMGIHDAVIATFNQIDGHIGEKFNKEFFESNLYAYRTLLELQNILNQCKSWVELNRDKSSVYTESEVMSSIDDALSSVMTVASNQISSRFKFLNRIIESGTSATINQYAMADITDYEVTKDMAETYLKNIQKDLSANNMVTINDGSFKDFELFVKQQSNGVEFWRQISSLVNSANVFNIEQLREYLNDPKNGLGAIKDSIIEYLDAYNDYRKAAYDTSFIETMQQAMQRRSSAAASNSASATAIVDIANNNTLNQYTDNASKVKYAVSELIGLATTAEDLGFISNSAALDRFFLNRMLRLNNRISHLYGDRSTLNNLVALTSKSHTNVWELDQLNQLLRDAKIEIDGEYTYIDSFDKNKKSFVIDVTDVNLGELLNEFRRQAIYGISEITALHNFITPYVDQITKAVRQRGFEQIVFKMDTAIDRILFSALNREIINATDGSTWDGVTLAIVPSITDKASGNVDMATSLKHQLLELTGEGNIGFYTILANNRNKDLKATNYLYKNKFTEAYVTGDYITRANEEVPVLYKDGDPKGITTHKVRDMGANGNSYIGTASALGFIDTATYSNAKTVKPTQYHISTGDYSENIVNDDGRVRTYDRYSEDDLEALADTAILNTVSPDDEDSRIVRANTNWEDNIVEGARINIGISSDGKITSATAYNAVMNIPALKAAYNKAQSIYQERQRRFNNGVYKSRDSILIPIDVNDVYIDGIKVHTRFNIVRDDMVALSAIKPAIVNTAKAINADKVTYTIDPSADKALLSKFAYSSDELAQMYITNPAVRKFFNSVRSNNAVNPDKTFIKIPDVILNKQNYVMDSLTEEEPSRLARLNVVALTQDSRPEIFFGTETNRGRIYNHEDSITVDFSSVPSTVDNNRGIVQKITDMFASLKKQKKEQIRHYTDNTKSEEEMTDKEYALYRDIHCDDIDGITEDLDKIDNKQGIDNSHLFPVLNRVKSANMLIRYRLNEQLGRQGSSVMRRLNGVRVGYVSHGISYNGSGSNLEVFTHELTHIPLEFLNMDSSANKTAIQLYNYVAKNIKFDHFTTKDAEDKRIFNYLFRNNTNDAHIEFLVYALTNSRFKDALNNLMKDKNLSTEFNSKLDSAFSRLLSKFDGNFEDKNILNVVDTIFTKSLDLAKHYYNKNPIVPPESYQAQSSILEPINKAITDKVHSFLMKIFPNRGVAPLFSQLTDAFNPDRTNNEKFKQIQATELVPQLANLLNDVGDGKNQLANELAQSFRAVSGDNWEYAKLRLASKEIVDKVREEGASAVNSIVKEISKKFSNKAMNNMPEYLLHADVQCLFATRDSNEVLQLIKDKEARYNEIKRLEKVLSKKGNGNFFINSAKGLANKLIYGVNTSGIGYNNAYEIANMCGTQAETKDSNLVYPIDDLVTLYTMHELDKKNPEVYKELADNFDAVEALTTIHNGIISLEKQHVYGDSSQKYHIPKGELHGGKSNNRYEIIPESQLKAYQWAGYMKVKNAKLDPLYKKLTNENYILVEGKLLPDVPYVDAATVLTDIFNGRNKQKGYIGGKPIEEAGFQEFYKDEHNNTVINYLNAQVKKLNNPDFVQIDPNSVDGMFTPSFGIGRSIVGTDFVLNEKETNKKLGREVKFTSALGDHFGSVIERNRAPAWNTKVAEALDEIYQERSNRAKFTWLTENETDPEREELYKLLPFEIKDYFAKKYPDKGVPIQEANITGVLGYRQLSSLKVDKEYYTKLKHSTEEYIDHLLHSAPVAYAESLARYLTRIGKENIVIKGIAVSLGNITSNCVTLGIQGLPANKVCSYQIEGLNWLRQYNSIKNEIALLKTKNVLGNFTKSDNARLQALHNALQHNPLMPLAEYGAIPRIAEDLSEQDRFTKDIIYKFVPQELQGIAHNVAGDQQSFLYNTLHDLATFGDITAKYALYKYLTEEKGIAKEEAVRQAITNFIDYSNPLPKPIQYLDSIGALPFTKFLLGNQTNVVNTLMKNPTGAMSWIMANNWMNVSSIYGSVLGLDSFTNRWHMPGFGLWYDSLSSLPMVRATKSAMDIL